ncbi:accessory gene regulator ArgB-like protein [Cellulosilyticum sp. I15G10I2]|uniref:accessory gene regulator ArgB-like protein n=1 Tax=Cellulosilyticum sp. I15G10I2 TaxID=1892843 RepID=UPI00085BEFDF|nr:accessory gene regulator B family protein [Cellulosilyticum sp. I15G10I2]
MTHLFERITDLFIHNGIISSEDKELYTYGLQQGLIIIANILTTLFIGLLLGMVWQSIVFMLSYIPLRSFAGGYHAKTQFKCYMLSIVLTTAVLLVIKLIPWTNFMIWSLALAAGTIILVFAPVANSNKPLNELEVNVYKKWTIIILLVELFFILLTMIFEMYEIGACIAISLFVLSNMLIIAKSNL